MAKKKVVEEDDPQGNLDEGAEKKPRGKKRVAVKVERPVRGEVKRPLSVGGVIGRETGKVRDWEAKAPWNAKDLGKDSRFERARTAKR